LQDLRIVKLRNAGRISATQLRVCSHVEDFERHTIDGNHRSKRVIPLEGHRLNSGRDSRTRKTMSSILTAGIVAPNFTLRVTPDQMLTLSDLRGKPVILAFYPADWSPVCGDQVTLYNELLSEFHKHSAEILGISVDGVWCHAAFARDRHLHFPLLADFEPKGAVAKEYGAYRNSEGVCERALFVLDRQGTIAWSYCSPIAVNPGADGILDALEQLSNQANAHGRLENADQQK
jgi:peroxiredoxin